MYLCVSEWVSDLWMYVYLNRSSSSPSTHRFYILHFASPVSLIFERWWPKHDWFHFPSYSLSHLVSLWWAPGWAERVLRKRNETDVMTTARINLFLISFIHSPRNSIIEKQINWFIVVWISPIVPMERYRTRERKVYASCVIAGCHGILIWPRNYADSPQPHYYNIHHTHTFWTNDDVAT